MTINTDFTEKELKQLSSIEHLVLNGHSFVSKKYAAELCDKFSKQENQSLREELNKEREKVTTDILMNSTPYNLMETLKKLTWATNYLLIDKSYDGHNYEELEGAVKSADVCYKNIVAYMELILLPNPSKKEPNPIEKISCRHCGKEFTDEYDLEAHVNFNHNQFTQKK